MDVITFFPQEKARRKHDAYFNFKNTMGPVLLSRKFENSWVTSIMMSLSIYSQSEQICHQPSISVVIIDVVSINISSSETSWESCSLQSRIAMSATLRYDFQIYFEIELSRSKSLCIFDGSQVRSIKLIRDPDSGDLFSDATRSLISSIMYQKRQDDADKEIVSENVAEIESVFHTRRLEDHAE